MQKSRRQYQQWSWLMLGVTLMVALWAGTVQAAEVRGPNTPGDIFRLSAEEVLNEDLYVGAGEIFIDGIIEGDLVAAGGYIEVNGEVAGDVIIAGGGIVINGRVGDDARLAGGGITIAGTISDDLFVAGGGTGWPGFPTIPFSVNGRMITQGIQLASSSTVGGDAYIVGGQGRFNGQINGELFSGMGTIQLNGRVGEDADLNAGQIEVTEGARVGGTLRYSSGESTTIPATVASTIIAEDSPAQQDVPRPNPIWAVLSWLWRTLLILLGFALLAWLIWRLAPGLLQPASEQVRLQPGTAGLYGVIATALIVPILLALSVAVAIFWGIGGAVATAAFTLGALSLLWMLSPLFIGYWLSRFLQERGYIQNSLLALIAGTLAVVLLTRLLTPIPCVGALVAGLIYLISFVLMLGGWILTRRQPATLAVAS